MRISLQIIKGLYREELLGYQEYDQLIKLINKQLNDNRISSELASYIEFNQLIKLIYKVI